MSIITRKINEKISRIKSEYEANKDVVHNGVKGALNENELSDLIKDIIPLRYKITKGIIENAQGEQSNETDVLIYDDEILPSYMKNDLSFVPVEAVKYNFEVKSSLNATELKTTQEKFKRFKSIGGTSPTVLFAFFSDIKGSEILRYYKNESNVDFFTNPSISVINVSGKCYYFKSVSECYVKEHFSNKEWSQMVSKSIDMDMEGTVNSFREMMSDNATLDQMDRATFSASIQGLIHMNRSMNNIDSKEVTVNEVKYSEMKYKIHRWYSVERDQCQTDNDTDLSFLSGISNTLSKGNFGKYLLDGKSLNIIEYAICFEDMWGNLSGQDFDENGLSYSTEKGRFSYENNKGNNKLTFHIEK